MSEAPKEIWLEPEQMLALQSDPILETDRFVKYIRADHCPICERPHNECECTYHQIRQQALQDALEAVGALNARTCGEVERAINQCCGVIRRLMK